MNEQKRLQTELQTLFDTDDFPMKHGRIGQAFIWVGSRSRDGRGWGSFQRVSESVLVGRKYRLSKDHTGCIHLRLLDDVFDPKTMTHSNPL